MQSTPDLEDYYTYTVCYPFDSIVKMLKMGRAHSSLQYRDIGLQPFENASFGMKKRFNRVRDSSLRDEMIKNNFPALHMGSFRPLSIQEYYYNENEVPILYDSIGTTTSNSSRPECSKVYKEVTFDIDITDYDRFCACSELKTVCDTCWLHMEGTCFILNELLMTRYGIEQENIMWIFSGGKGIHCFVNDSKMLKMTENARMNLYNDLFVDKTNDYIAHCIKYHHSQFYDSKMIQALQDLFVCKVIGGKRQLLQSNVFVEFILKKLNRHYNKTFCGVLKGEWYRSDTNSLEKWSFLLQLEEKLEDRRRQDEYNYLKPSIYIILSLYYPMIDKMPLQLNHLIKSPFSIHTKTGKISLPVDKDVIMDYDTIKSFPTLQEGNGLYYTHPLFKRGKEILNEWVTYYHLF